MFFTNKEKEALLKRVKELELKLKDEEMALDYLKDQHRKEKKSLELKHELAEDELTRKLKKLEITKENNTLEEKIAFEKEYLEKLSKKQQEYHKAIEQLESDCSIEKVNASRLETENSVLKAELGVLRKLEDKSDEYREAIHSLELQIADKQARIQLMNEKSIRDEKEIAELKAQLKEANDRIFTITTKEPIIVRPEVLTPAVIEPTILSSKK